MAKTSSIGEESHHSRGSRRELIEVMIGKESADGDVK
jgi:hypothetical protein